MGTAANQVENKLAGLDGLRAVAVLMVLLFHQEVLPVGWAGVQIFFVLSGYLITRSLFRTRGLGIGTYLRDFYGRRSLRVFPLYFSVLLALTLAVLLGMTTPGVGKGLPYAFTYTYNLWHATNSYIHSKLIAHFWSLCVEEQFYLVWPFLIYFCPERALKPMLLGIVLLGPLIRWAIAGLLLLPGVPANPDTHVALYVLTPSHADAFALGAYASLFSFRGRAKGALYATLALQLACGLAVAAFADRHVGGEKPPTWDTLGYPLGMAAGFAYVWGYSLFNFASAFLIDCLVHRRLASWFFDSTAMRYLGKISYGFYVFHYPVQAVLAPWLHGSLVLMILVQVLVTTGIASLSFHLWEARFLTLKDRFFSHAAATPPAAPEATRATSEA